jgi:hypothetical protein
MNSVNFSIATPRFGKTALRSASPTPTLQFGGQEDGGTRAERQKSPEEAQAVAQNDEIQKISLILKEQGDKTITFTNGMQLPVAAFLGYLCNNSSIVPKSINQILKLQGLPSLEQDQKDILEDALDKLVNTKILSAVGVCYGISNNLCC